MNHLLIIKTGTSTLTTRNDRGAIVLDAASFASIGAQVESLKAAGYQVILVSSAAIAAGMSVMNSRVRPTEIPALQALASIGWRHILNSWQQSMHSPVGELLVTTAELERSSERSELLSVIQELLKQGVTPIMNENDAIAHTEISFGDNDILAARLAATMQRSPLFDGQVSVVLLSDIDGVYADVSDPQSVIRHINSTQEYITAITTAKSDGGSGGMASKFMAADIVMAAGGTLFIANGRSRDGIGKTIDGEGGTRFSREQE